MKELQKTLSADTFQKSNNSSFLDIVSYVSEQLAQNEPNTQNN